MNPNYQQPKHPFPPLVVEAGEGRLFIPRPWGEGEGLQAGQHR